MKKILTFLFVLNISIVNGQNIRILNKFENIEFHHNSYNINNYLSDELPDFEISKNYRNDFFIYDSRTGTRFTNKINTDIILVYNQDNLFIKTLSIQFNKQHSNIATEEYENIVKKVKTNQKYQNIIPRKLMLGNEQRGHGQTFIINDQQEIIISIENIYNFNNLIGYQLIYEKRDFSGVPFKLENYSQPVLN